MKREQIKQLINNLHISQISLDELYNFYSMDKLDELMNPFFESMKELCGKYLWDWITWRVYECPDIIKENGYVLFSYNGVGYELENIDDFLDFLIISEYIIE